MANCLGVADALEITDGGNSSTLPYINAHDFDKKISNKTFDNRFDITEL
ncbi:MAG: hypothetical protein LBB05_00905 [Puniceicoccales bacterium]|nr:hypothetical protein [Puniceicoccales bacterium]